MRTFSSFAIVLSTAVLLAACSSTKVDDNAPVENRVDAGAGADMSGVDTRAVNIPGTGADPLNDPQSILSRRSIYFDYDRYSVKEEFLSVIKAHATYLNAHKDHQIIIQGNTDDRGGAEYNLALGQKRAEAVRKALALLGVSEIQLEAVSFGKEKPKALGNDESAWSENRRADIVYK
ncbi:MAG: peptidoglycan-associated lipoprotein Pal [Herbaspirillum sp.]